MKGKYPLIDLLNYSGLSKSTYFDNINKQNAREHKDDELAKIIESIFIENYKKYGSPRIAIELHNRGIIVNEKKVARIMKKYHISAKPKAKRYSSYKGEVGLIADRLVNRGAFDSGCPGMIFGTDVTQFKIGEDKIYLSPIIDFHTREIVAHDISERPNMKQIYRMMDRFEERYGLDLHGAIIHSDQGWQYQQKWFQDWVHDHNMKQSMSRKGNCLDNSPTENFFGRLKEEMFYGQEWRYETVKELVVAIDRWIKYYNNTRIVTILKNSPAKYLAAIESVK